MPNESLVNAHLSLKEKLNNFKKTIGQSNAPSETQNLFTRRISCLPTNIKNFKSKFTNNLDVPSPLAAEGSYRKLSNEELNSTTNQTRGKAITKEAFKLPFPKGNLKLPNNDRMGKSVTNLLNYLQPIQSNLNENKRRHEEDKSSEVPEVKKFQVENNLAEESALLFGFVFNIAFAIVKLGNERKIFFKCNIPGCSLDIFDENQLKIHVDLKHKDLTWNGFCSKCMKINFFPEQKKITLIEEINHIEENHVAKGLLNKNNVKTITLCRGKIVEPDRLGKFRQRSMTVDSKAFNRRDPRTTAQINKIDNTESFYNTFDNINIQPWLGAFANQKAKAAVIAMLHERPLSALFKCMEKNCVYYTSDDANFKRHLSLHKAPFLCSYCLYKGITVEDMIKHIIEIHGDDCYQCAYCFYRSFNKATLMTHAKLFHSEKTIVMFKPDREDNKEVMDKLQKDVRSHENVSKFVLTIQCICNQEFYNHPAFESHIRICNCRDEKYCIKCKKFYTLSNIVEHNENCLKVSSYQCLHCLWGVPNHHKMYEHLANLHPSKYPMYCDRTEINGNHLPSDYKSLCLKIVVHKATNVIVISNNYFDNLSLRNTEAVECISYENREFDKNL